MKRSAYLWLFAGLVMVFAGGLVWIFSLLFASGNLYPPYSTLRADPLGGRVLYESLKALEDREVIRSFAPAEAVDVERPSTVFFLGATPLGWSYVRGETADLIQETTRRGGTVVLAFAPGTYTDNLNNHLRNLEARFTSEESFRARFGLAFQTATREDLPSRARLLPESPPLLPTELPVRTSLSLVPETDHWTEIYADAAGTVLAERPLGRGRLVVLADAYPLSNEGLAYEREIALLQYLSGDTRRMIFSESHLGLAESPGIGTLIRRYGLFPFLGGLLCCGLLFVWRSSLPLVPPVPDRGSAGTDGRVIGRTSAEGFVSLLQRGIAPPDLPATCWKTWKDSVLSTPGMARKYAETRESAEALLREPEARNNPLETFQTLNEKFKSYKDPS